jgi:hypothetical protein
VLQLRLFLTRHLQYPRRNPRCELSQILLALIYPIVLGLDRLETASLLRANGTFQYLTGLPSYPDPQTLRRFLLQAPPEFRRQLDRLNDRLLRQFIHQPEHRSRLILDLDSTVVTVFGRQEGAEVGCNPRCRGKRSYDPLLCLEANFAFLWDTELRSGNAGTWAGSEELLASCFLPVSLPGLVDQPIVDARWRLELLPGARGHGTADLPIAGGLRSAKNPHPRLCRQRALPADSPLGLQLGEAFPTNVSADRMAGLHLNQTASPIVLAARRTNSTAEPPCPALAQPACYPTMDDAHSTTSPQTQTAGPLRAIL